VTGKFFAFKGTQGTGLAKVDGGWANNYGRNIELYTNLSDLKAKSDVKWFYKYRLNGTGEEKVTAVGRDTFGEVWYTTKEVSSWPDPVSHKTTYTVTAVYPTGRFGTPSTNDQALTSKTTFDYTVVDPVAKQEYVTTVGDITPLNEIINDPGKAIKNSRDGVSIPSGPEEATRTTYRWVSAPDASTVSTPGIYKKDVTVTLPKGAQTGDNSSDTVPVTIKVRPKPPQISADQVTNTGGLPNKGITVTNALPNAQVTLTIGGKTLTKQADGSGNVTFPSTDVADSNGLLPTGDVTVKQSKAFTNPVTNANETLESDASTVNISKEDIPPTVALTVKVNGGTPETDSSGRYIFYAGDTIQITYSGKDNSGKLTTLKMRNANSDLNDFFEGKSAEWGRGPVENITTLTSTNQTTKTVNAVANSDMTWKSGNIFSRVITAVDPNGNTGESPWFGVVQGRLADKIKLTTPPAIPVRDKSNLTPTEKERIKTEVEKSNPSDTSRIRTYDVQPNGDVTITFKDGTSKTITPNLEQNYQTKSDRFYAVAGENPNSLTARDFIKSADGTDLPANTNVVWKNGVPNLSTPGEKTATLTVTDSKGVSKEITYNYTVYPKVEANTNNGVTGKFYSFKDDGNGRTNGGSWANNYGGDTYLYVNQKELPANTTWSYEYKLNSQLSGSGELQKTPVGTQSFSSVWNNTQAHQTEYRVVATYPTGRFGTPSAQDRALTSETTFNYTVVNPVAKKVYETTVGNMSPLSTISTTPGETITNAANTPVIPAGTDYAWETPLSESDISTPGYITKKVKVTLPLGAATGNRNDKLVPVTIKVNLKTPQIADDQVRNTGGLPNPSITVTDVTPGATVTLRIGSKEIPKTVPAGATSVAFGADELADSNGLLPTGNVTVTQTKVVTNPEGNPETLSTSTTKEITRETVKPVARTTVQVKNPTTGKWETVPSTRDGVFNKYIFYSGDQLRFITTFSDNSGKIDKTEVKIGDSNGNTTITSGNILHDPWGTATLTNLNNTPTVATETKPYTIDTGENHGEIKSDLPYSSGNTVKRSVIVRDTSGNWSEGNNLILEQGQLKDKFRGKVPATVQVTNATTPSADDKEKILAAVKGSNPEKDNRISSYALKDNGAVSDGKVTVVITYKDGTTNEVKVPVSDSDRKSEQASQSASESASTSASQSASTSASESARTSASQSASTSASQSASTSASQSASTSASQSASTSASQSASTSASESASTSASQSASTSASASASTSAS
ncbi:Rib/alpha-like domain-containing protein, partial [Streptococcus mitis]|uniref:Rib/alpha-like domain-containing protein n=1 Tax=Streptococcus mitis TaxID=28037 RepID=UPI0028DC701C